MLPIISQPNWPKLIQAPIKLFPSFRGLCLNLNCHLRVDKIISHVRFPKPFIPNDFTDSLMASYDREFCGDGCSDEEDLYWPPISKGCWNCGGPHNHRLCPQQYRRVFCYLCGWQQVTVAMCQRPSCRQIREHKLLQALEHQRRVYFPDEVLDRDDSEVGSRHSIKEFRYRWESDGTESKIGETENTEAEVHEPPSVDRRLSQWTGLVQQNTIPSPATPGTSWRSRRSP